MITTVTAPTTTTHPIRPALRAAAVLRVLDAAESIGIPVSYILSDEDGRTITIQSDGTGRYTTAQVAALHAVLDATNITRQVIAGMPTLFLSVTGRVVDGATTFTVRAYTDLDNEAVPA